jgi:hypothetical protein
VREWLDEYTRESVIRVQMILSPSSIRAQTTGYQSRLLSVHYVLSTIEMDDNTDGVCLVDSGVLTHSIRCISHLEAKGATPS